MRTMACRQLGAASNGLGIARAGGVDGGIIIIMSHRRKLP